ncbi:DUF4118 domain-containing protein [Comamonas sp. NLF-1-9]|uniref:DUF4118 domain-containing protein n=1 Tax=Comamonas sp. NLF-1-9 TaxID=2853163 RepID=UPI001C477F6D|nr:DUF4118 domain-containing protein [Comamonas sp. NLF-1-9]QXL83827.1 DUF4118 domain-containing protein [Comamonas sp. NLF-1-9]
MPTSAPAPDVDQRPDPDALLARVRQDEKQAGHGRLKVFFGASAGVGKTYAMLSAARTALGQGVPLVVGLVETHGRAETEAVAEGLPRLPLKAVPYRERVLNEFGLDAALAFGLEHAGGAQPPLVLLDELAHSNAPGSRHPKRWQDVEELLAAGIDVWSTMNVQHLESLNDIVGDITGVRVWETVPDHILDAADEVVVVDLPPDELLARLAAGKVYVPQQAERAAAHFFRKGNLIALRELVLRRAADRADTQIQHWRRANAGGGEQPVWATREALLAAIGPNGGENVVRRAARLAAQLDVPWHAVFVDVLGQRLGEAAREQALRALRLAQELGATTATLAAPELAPALVGHAREHNLSRLVMGRSRRRPWRLPLDEQVGRIASELDVLQVALSKVDRQGATQPARGADVSRSNWAGYGFAAAWCLALALLAQPLAGVLELTNIVMLFLLVVVVVALRHGRAPAVLAALLGVALFDFFFVPPRMSLAVSDVQYLVTFAVMLVVALVIGQLTAGLRAQAHAASERERRVRGLYQMSRELSAALLPEQVAEIGARFLRGEFGARSALLALGDDDKLLLQPGADAELDPAVAQWCFDKGEPAGRGTNTLPASACLVLPLTAPMRRRGVLAVQPAQSSSLAPEQRQVLDTCASLLAISLERIHYVQVAQQSTVHMESERLRNSLLAAISHDLRTPLAAMVGLADTLALTGAPLQPQQAEVVQAIRGSALRMNAQVNNLLDMARLEVAEVQLSRAWLPLEEVVGSAIATCSGSLAGRAVATHLAGELPLLHLDAELMERVFVNLLENAVKYTPQGSPLDLRATLDGAEVVITLDDHGPGLPPGREEAVFKKFERGTRESVTPGVGLGLGICRAIVQAHGGRIVGVNRMEGDRVRGARFTIRLPVGQPPLDDGSAQSPV